MERRGTGDDLCKQYALFGGSPGRDIANAGLAFIPPRHEQKKLIRVFLVQATRKKIECWHTRRLAVP